MMFISEKFANEQDARHNGILHWNCPLGLPIRSNAQELQLKDSDYARLIPVSDFKSYLFDLSKEEDRKYYHWVNDHIYNGLFSLIYKEMHWDKEKDVIKVYMEWTQNYLELPNRLMEEAITKIYPMESLYNAD
ncbi:MAG: hypothetical protein QXQ37_03010 [Nitrososphaerota archaeon]